MLETVLTFLLGVLIAAAPWFHGLSGVLEQFAAQVLIYLLALFFSLGGGRDFFCGGFRDPFAKGWGAAVLLSAFLTMISVLPFYSLMTWIRFFSHWVIYRAALSVCMDRKRRNFLMWIIVLAGVVYCVYGWLQIAGYFPHDYWYSRKSMAARYVNGGHFAAFLIVPIFLSLNSILTTRKVWLKAMNLSIFILLLASLVLTRSRTVWISVGLGFFFYLWTLVRLKLINKKLLAGLAAILLISVAALWGSGYWIKIAARFLEIWDGHHLNIFSLVHRFVFWQGSLHAIIARPWGWGLGTFVHILPGFRTHSDRFLVDYAHNETLQIGVDLGIAGILLLYGVLWMVVHSTWKALTEDTKDALSKIRLTGLLVSFLCLFVSSQFDFPLRIYATSLIASIFLAIMAAEIVSLEAGNSPRPCRIGLSRRIAAAAILLFCLGVSAAQLYAQTCFRTGVGQEKNFQWNESLASYRRASLWGPWNGDFYEAFGRLSLKRSKLSFQPLERKQYQTQALQNFKRATQLNRFWPASYFIVGTLLSQNDNTAEAEKYFEKAANLEPTNAFYLSQYARRALENGEIQKALGLYERYQRLAFREKGPSTEQILNQVYVHTQDPNDLRRVAGPSWQDQYTYGRFLAQKERWDDAILVIDLALKAARKEMGLDFMAHLGGEVANFYVDNKKFAEALAIYETALVEKPQDLRWRTRTQEVRNLLAIHAAEHSGTS